MAIGVTSEHEELASGVRRWAVAHCPPAVVRAAAEPDAPAPPDVFVDAAAQGWFGVHVEEARGGQGFSVLELAVVLGELGRVLLPGPVLPTVLAASALDAAAGPVSEEVLPSLADGSATAGVYLGPGALEARPAPGADGSLVVSGSLTPVLGAPARWLLVPVSGHGWCVLDGADPGIKARPLAPLDATRPLAEVAFDAVTVDPARFVSGVDGQRVSDLAVALAAAEAAGAARWCLETASDYAKVRVQFGRPIGQFQAVKHKLADMLVSVEQAEAVAWDAANAWGAGPGSSASEAEGCSLASAVAGAVALDAAVNLAKTCVQVLGGIGFTWEHDAHLYLRRALATRQLLGGSGRWRQRVVDLALGGARRSLASDLPPEAAALRAGIADEVASVAAADGDERRRRLVDAGLVAPNWPRPWGRDATALEQLVIDEALREAKVRRPPLAVAAWVLPTLIAHGSPAQQERWIRPTLLGELTWCQLFSEPGAGSDLASLSTRAQRTDGGWLLNGQKVWTTLAHQSDFGICLARSDPSAPKHAGIPYFVVDMKSDGIDIRPLRELTGDAMFNEVFLTDVFVPDDCVVGAPGAGWGIGRTTLANERVSMSSGATFGIGVESVLRRLAGLGDSAPPGAATEVGALLAEAQSVRLLGHRATLRSLSGTDPGSGASVRKLLGAEHEQRVQEMGLVLGGPAGAVDEEEGKQWAHGFLVTRCLTIAGGTSEVQRNVMAERVLGQPRDPEPGG